MASYIPWNKLILTDTATCDASVLLPKATELLVLLKIVLAPPDVGQERRTTPPSHSANL